MTKETSQQRSFKKNSNFLSNQLTSLKPKKYSLWKIIFGIQKLSLIFLPFSFSQIKIDIIKLRRVGRQRKDNKINGIVVSARQLLKFIWQQFCYYPLIYFIIKMMRRSITLKSATKKSVTPIKYSPSHSNNTNTSTLYFCHYKNAMYMGGINSFKKDGKGILIHDCGLSVVTSYLNDLMHGHNIFFSQHCLLSAEYVKGKIVEAVYRTDGYMAHFYYNNDVQLEGKCKLLNYINKAITYATFRKGTMIQKEEQTDITLLNKVFQMGELQFLIGKVHSAAIKYDIKKTNNIDWQKYGNKLTIGFEKNGVINGLAFTLIFRGSHGGYNPQTHRNQDEFELRVVQRGYMASSHLNGFGEKLFKNGNLYIGEFKNGIFEGNGILRNTAKKNWVSGYFEKGNLIDLLQYNNEGEQKKYDKIIEAMHQRKTNWINNEVALFEMEVFDKQIEKILSSNTNTVVKNLEQRKQDVLRKIQDNFLCQPNSVPNFLETAKDMKLFDKPKDEKSSVKRFVNSFIPQVQKSRLNNEENSGQDGYELSQSRRMPNSIRKSKIFDRSNSFDKHLKASQSPKRRKAGDSPDSKKKIFNLSTAPSKMKKKELFLNEVEGSPQANANEEHSNVKSPKEDSNANNSMVSLSQKKELKKKKQMEKSFGKSKIFNYLQDQSQEAGPKFIYTHIDTSKDSQKRKKTFDFTQT